ncbi:MAG: hypothetical protein WC729_03905 [Sphingomonas sp.]|jgi:hypothetical protein|uniref:hypothetical protein n=1 Tax=Sphingomonas sp. TaxID=28214 RepID=UPI0035618CAB
MAIQSSGSFEELSAAQNPCPVDETAMTARSDAIAKTYEQRFAELAAQVQQEAKQITDDAPKPSAAGTAVGVDVEIGSKKHTIVIDLPQFTMRDQDFVFSIPEMASRRQEWKYKIPASRMVTKCVDGPPEIICPTKMRCVFGICTKVPDGPCRTRRGTICTDVPEFYMNEVTTVLDVPEATMKRRTYTTKVPQVRMTRRELSFNIPTVTVSNVRAELRQVKERSDELAAMSSEKGQGLAQAMQAEIDQGNAAAISDQFECSRNHLNSVLQAGLTYFDNQIAIFTAGRDKALEVGASAIASQNDTTIAQLVAARNTFADETRVAISKLAPVERQQINEVLAAS